LPLPPHAFCFLHPSTAFAAAALRVSSLGLPMLLGLRLHVPSPLSSISPLL
jgi:hypothetical protein